MNSAEQEKTYLPIEQLALHAQAMHPTQSSAQTQLERGLAWLRHINRQQHDIFIRPAEAESTTLILVDDLDAAATDRVKRDGLPPAVILETSPSNYQTWIRISLDPIARKDATAVSRELAHRYGGDPGSVGWRHYSRLAGFTSQKPSRRRPDGRQPFVLLVESTEASAAVAFSGLLTAAHARTVRTAAPGPTTGWASAQGADAALPAPGANYRRRAKALRRRYPNADHSRLD